MTAKGQIIILSKIRCRLRVKKRTRVQVDVDELTHKAIPASITCDYIHSLRGKYNGRELLKALASDKKQEQKL